MHSGPIYAIACYGLWGFIPIFWKLLSHVPSGQILAHRIVWSLLFMAIALLVKKDIAWVWELRRKPKLFAVFLAISALISVNWFTFIWGVNSGYIVETSLGYFINPLLSVFLGVVFFKEKPSMIQTAAIALAFVGVAYLTFAYGRPPWIALILASTFALYGLLKKLTALGPLRSLTLETSYMVLPALAYLFFVSSQGEAVFLQGDASLNALLILSGFVTGVPLLLFGAAAKKLSMTALGLTQYLAPTIQFLIGVLVYDEGFSSDQAVGFGIIWLALIIFTTEVVRKGRRVRKERALLG